MATYLAETRDNMCAYIEADSWDDAEAQAAEDDLVLLGLHLYTVDWPDMPPTTGDTIQ